MSTSTRRSCLVAMLGAIFIIGELPADAQKQKKDPFIGNWELDGTQSTFDPGPVPAGEDLVFEAVDNGFRNIVRTEGIGGTQEYTVKFDGKDYPNDASSVVDTYSAKRIDANTIERTGKVRGMVVEKATFRVSPDGNILTITVKGSFQGLDYSSTQVYNRL